MAEKLSWRSNSSCVTTIPALISHIYWARENENLTAFPALREILRSPPDICVIQTFFSPLLTMDICKNLSLHYTPIRMSLHVWERDKKTNHRGSECFYHLTFLLRVHYTADDCFILYDVSVCWRLRVLCMKIKCALWQLCLLTKNDGFFYETSDLWAQN